MARRLAAAPIDSRTAHTIDDIKAMVVGALTDRKLAALDATVTALVAAEASVASLLKTIRTRKEATLAVRASTVTSSRRGLTLSVRVAGVECGEVRLPIGAGARLFSPTRRHRHFAACWSASKAALPWEHPLVLEFLRSAASKAFEGDLADRECGVEAAFAQLLRERRLLDNAPVLFPSKSGVPYQFPVPISARAQVRAASGGQAGHVDLLARHGRGPNSVLRVLELKKPNASDAGHALDQAVAYAAALNVLLRRDAPYAQLFGYRKRSPRLEATAVIADSPAAHAAMEAAIPRLRRKADDFDVRLSALFYAWAPGPGPRRLQVVHEMASQ